MSKRRNKRVGKEEFSMTELLHTQSDPMQVILIDTDNYSTEVGAAFQESSAVDRVNQWRGSTILYGWVPTVVAIDKNQRPGAGKLLLALMTQQNTESSTT
jgi:hypothetical protein